MKERSGEVSTMAKDLEELVAFLNIHNPEYNVLEMCTCIRVHHLGRSALYAAIIIMLSVIK